MERCIACGREFSGQGEVCAECQGEGRLVAPQHAAKPAIAHRLTLLLIVSNCAVFLLMVAMGVSFTNPTPYDVYIFGGTEGVDVLYRLHVWRLLTSNYLHYGIIHLAVNMYCLWGLGQLVELFYSRTDYALLYTYTGIAGSVLGVMIHPSAVSAGASGAIFGVAGVLLTTLRYGRLPLPERSRNILFKEILQFAGINLVLGFFILRVSNAGHIGGLIGGLLVGWVMGKHLDNSPQSAAHRRRAWIALWLGLVFLFIVFRIARVGTVIVR